MARVLLSKQRPGHTLQPTALVHEACVKLLEHPDPQIANRAHLLAVLARAMRQVLVDHARAASAEKRGGSERRVTWDTNIEIPSSTGPRSMRMLEIDRVLDALARENPGLSRIVEMHYFGGMTAEEAAIVEGRSPHAIRHELRAARAWMKRELARAG